MLYLIRHGESLHNVNITQDLDSDLTNLGVEQSHKTGKFLYSKIKRPFVCSSSFLRASHTGKIISRYFHQSEPVEDILLGEYIYEGAGYAEQLLPYAIKFNIFSKLETKEELISRVIKRINEAKNKTFDVVFITHGGFIDTAINVLNGKNIVPTWDKSIKNCSITEYDFKTNKFGLFKYTGHLE